MTQFRIRFVVVEPTVIHRSRWMTLLCTVCIGRKRPRWWWWEGTLYKGSKAFEAIVRIGVLTQPDALSHAMGHWHPVCGLLCGVKSHTKRTSGAAYGKLISCWSLERETSFVATGSKSQALSSPLLRLMGERVLRPEEFHYRRSNPILYPQSMVMRSSSMCNLKREYV